jgi:hypothetical protein
MEKELAFAKRLSSAPNLAQPARNRPPPGSHARISNAAIFREGAFRPGAPHPDSLGIALEEQAIAGPHSHEQANVARHGNPSIAGHFRLRLH